ncbi:MAG: peptide ABC transporter substrate-binding protein [Anaerolineae bacterium]|nr:peptide ABC transporter substrate-binding protein [Anaerolineae bacterium]
MFGKYRRMIGLVLVLTTVLGLLVGVARAQDEAVLVIGWEQEPDVLGDGSSSTFSQLLGDFYSRKAYGWNGAYQVYSDMMAEIPSIENGMVTTNEAGNTVVTHKLKEGLLWSDGEAVTADDCLFGHKLFSDTSTGSIFRSDYPSVVESLEKVDDLTIVQTFNTVYPDFLGSDNITVMPQCRYPEHVLQPLMDANGGTIDGLSFFTTGEGWVGFGPYTLESWTKGDNITMVANPNWTGQQPAFGRVILKFILESAQMQNALDTGEIDVAFNWQNDMLEGYQAIEGVEIWNTGSPYADALWFNIDEDGNNHPALRDVNVRKAIIHAIDRANITTAIAGEGVPVPGAFDSSVWWPEGLEILGYDVALANQLLDEAGWVDSNGDGLRDKDGLNLILKFFTTPRQSRIDYQLAIQANLQEVGIGTQLFQVPGPAVLFASLTNLGIMASSDYDLAIYASSNDPVSPNVDPSSFSCAGIPSPENPASGNFSHYCDPAFDELIPQIASTLDPAARLALKHQSVELMNSANFWAGLYVRVTWYAVRTDRVNTEGVKDGLGTLASNWFQQIEYWQPAG